MPDASFLDKFLWIVVTAVFGIVAAVLVPRFLDWRRRERIKDALVSELETLLVQIKGTFPGYARSIQLARHAMIDNYAAPRLASTVFDNFYKEVCFELTSEQRQSFEGIYSQIDAIEKVNQSRFMSAIQGIFDGKRRGHNNGN